MEKIDCIFCGINNENVFIEENGYKGRKCRNCNLIYISPRPTLNEIIDLYGHDDANISAEDHIKASFYSTLYAKHNLKLIQKHIKKGKLLEIGAGAGYFLKEAKKLGFKSHAIEFNEKQAKFITNTLSIPCERIALNNQSFGEEKFDLIYHCDVISHFYEPIDEFKKMANKLNNGGFVVFETGNFGDVDPKYFKYVEKYQYPDHLFFFSEKNLKSLLTKSGFELVEIHYFSILAQLRLLTIKKKIIGLFKNKSKNLQSDKSQTKKSKINEVHEHGYKDILLNALYYLMYLSRYKIGKYLPLKERPQTMVIIAQKK